MQVTGSKVNNNDLKDRVKTGEYVPSPDAVAKAMLKRPGLRLLFGINSATVAGQSQTA